jgi:hypothetical protein
MDSETTEEEYKELLELTFEATGGVGKMYENLIEGEKRGWSLEEQFELIKKTLKFDRNG